MHSSQSTHTRAVNAVGNLILLLAAALQAAAKAVLAMQQKPPDPPGASLSSAPPPGQDREAALALSGEEAFARRAMYAFCLYIRVISCARA